MNMRLRIPVIVLMQLAIYCDGGVKSGQFNRVTRFYTTLVFEANEIDPYFESDTLKLIGLDFINL